MTSFKKKAYSKQLIYTKQLITISFSNKAYSKHLIYAKQLITMSFSKTAYLCYTTCLCKTAYKLFCITKLF